MLTWASVSVVGSSPTGHTTIRKTLGRLAFCYVFSTVDSKAAFVMSHLITFKVHGTPVGKGRPRISTRGGFVRSYTPEKTRDWECHVSDVAHGAMLNAGAVPTYDAVHVVIDAYYPVPASYSKKKRAACINGEVKPMSKPDIDNVVKALLDAMNKVVYVDDKQVVNVQATKHYTDQDEGFVVVEVSVE